MLEASQLYKAWPCIIIDCPYLHARSLLSSFSSVLPPPQNSCGFKAPLVHVLLCKLILIQESHRILHLLSRRTHQIEHKIVRPFINTPACASLSLSLCRHQPSAVKMHDYISLSGHVYVCSPSHPKSYSEFTILSRFVCLTRAHQLHTHNPPLSTFLAPL